MSFLYRMLDCFELLAYQHVRFSFYLVVGSFLILFLSNQVCGCYYQHVWRNYGRHKAFSFR